jgi:hypothetical protein
MLMAILHTKTIKLTNGKKLTINKYAPPTLIYNIEDKNGYYKYIYNNQIELKTTKPLTKDELIEYIKSSMNTPEYYPDDYSYINHSGYHNDTSK